MSYPAEAGIHWVTFRSTRDAIRAEREMRALNLLFRVIAVPREISAGCGMALEFSSRDIPPVTIEEMLTRHAIAGLLHVAPASQGGCR